MVDNVKGPYGSLKRDLISLLSRSGVDRDVVEFGLEGIHARFGSAFGAISTSHHARAEVFGERGATMLDIIIALAGRRLSDEFVFGRVHSEKEIADLLTGKTLGYSSEVSFAVFLSKDGRALACEYIGEGTVNSLNVTPRRIIEYALEYGATRVVIGHNHPLGTARPSEEDIGSTYRLARVLASAGIRLEYHMIVAGMDATMISVDPDGLDEAVITRINWN